MPTNRVFDCSRHFCVAAFIVLSLCAASACAQTQIVLDDLFIKKYKDTVTIDLKDFVVKFAHERPNRPVADGDLHAAGTSDKVGLAIVAEIMNAASHDDAVNAIHAAEESGKPTKLSGVWRVWCEHARKGSKHVQFGRMPEFEDSNPDHVFEIHPITSIGGKELLDSFSPIDGFEKVLRKKGRTAKAFNEYENKACEIRHANGKTTIITKVARPNYVEFTMKLVGKPKPLEDGLAVRADVFDPRDTDEEDALAEDIRMVFVAETDPAKRVKGLKVGDTLHVLGIPRISLVEVRERIEASKDDPDALTLSLPYEMIIVAIMPE